jgi:hypothetical protein
MVESRQPAYREALQNVRLRNERRKEQCLEKSVARAELPSLGVLLR